MIDTICSILKYAFIILTCYKWIYIVIGFFAKKKVYPETDVFKKYAVIICARNEEKVIGKLLESVRLQDYPKDKLDAYVVCDNCTDKTKEIAENSGARTIVRNDTEHMRKGYALEYAFSRIDTKEYDGFFIIDADNLLAKTFVREMNKAFAAGNRVVTCYRNIKNFDTNIISSGYGFHFYANNIAYHRPRGFLNIGTHLTGTGYLFDARLLDEMPWHFTNLTEDDEFTIMLTERNVKVAYCEDAEIYDEQPVDVGTAFRQRVRWARGRLVAFVKHGGRLFKAIFTTRDFTGYDLFWHYFPLGMCTWFLGLIYPATSVITSVLTHDSINYAAILGNIGGALLATALYGLLTGVLVAIKEGKRIYCKKGLLFIYLILSPWFLLVDTLHNIVALFWNIKWTRIRHIDDRGIEDVHR